MCFFTFDDDLFFQSFLLLFSMISFCHSCAFQIVYGNNLSQPFFVLINLCFCAFYIFSGVGDLFFSLYNLSHILISLFNYFVLHGFLFLYIIFFFSKGKLKWKYVE